MPSVGEIKIKKPPVTAGGWGPGMAPSREPRGGCHRLRDTSGVGGRWLELNHLEADGPNLLGKAKNNHPQHPPPR